MRDAKRMTLKELRDMSDRLDVVSQLFKDAARFESTHAHHPSALSLEEKAEELLDAALLEFSRIRSRASA